MNTTDLLIVANFKMTMVRRADIVAYCNTLRGYIDSVPDIKQGVRIVLCPSAPHYDVVSRLAQVDSRIACGAQDVFWHTRGAYTGQLSPLTLYDAGVRYVLVGHSEQHRWRHMDDAAVGRQVAAVLAAKMTPIIFVGETAQEREHGHLQRAVMEHLRVLTQHVDAASLQRCVLVYEPVWAIGAQSPPDAEDIMAARILVQKIIAQLYDTETAQSVRILYGGSVTPENITQFTPSLGVRGVVVGRAARQPRDLLRIAASLRHCYNTA